LIQVYLSAEHKPWLLCTDGKDGRDLLTNVFIDPAGYVIATNPHALCVCRVRIEEAPEGWAGALVPGSLLKKAKPIVRGGNAFINIETDKAWAFSKDGKLESPLGEGKYPDWRRVLPHLAERSRDAADLPIGLNFLLAADARSAIGGHHVTPFVATGQYAPLVLLAEDAFAVVMPGGVSANYDHFSKFYREVSEPALTKYESESKALV
jgi:hypothetical protein